VRVLVVTGTDTGVGKTVVTAALAAAAWARGLTVAAVKAAQTGEDADAEEVRRLSGVQDVHELARFPEPLAPATAAARAGSPGLGADGVARAIRGLAGRDLVLVEGAGGLLVRLAADDSTLLDVAAALAAPVLVVARAGLGTLNHTALTCAALAARGVACPGVVVGSWPAAPGPAEQANLADLPQYAGRPLLGRVPEGAGRLAPAAFARQAPNWIATEGLL